MARGDGLNSCTKFLGDHGVLEGSFSRCGFERPIGVLQFAAYEQGADAPKFGILFSECMLILEALQGGLQFGDLGRKSITRCRGDKKSQ